MLRRTLRNAIYAPALVVGTASALGCYAAGIVVGGTGIALGLTGVGFGGAGLAFAAVNNMVYCRWKKLG